MSMRAMKHVFLSYSTRDREFVDTLRNDLKTSGINVWIDQEELNVGTPNWERAIRDAIREAFAVVVIASPNAYDSRYVQGELEIASMYNLRIFPVWAFGENDRWVEYIPLHLIKTQYVDMRGKLYFEGLPKLISELQEFTLVSQHKQPFSEIKRSSQNHRNPFKGLRAFTSHDAEDFFGRERFIGELVTSLREHRQFLAIIGPSGSGKSSIIMAGLLPKLKQGCHYWKRKLADSGTCVSRC